MEPKLFPHLQWVWDAFQFLSRTRQVYKNGPMPIPASEVLAYCEMTSIHDEDRRTDLMYFINSLDIEWCRTSYAHIAEQQEKARKELERNKGKRRR